MGVLYTNDAASTIAQSISAGTTTVVLASGTGTIFPHPMGGGDFFMLKLINPLANPVVSEIVAVTARTGDTLTVQRAQEGTSASAFPGGSIASHRVTAGTLQRFLDRNGDTATGPINLAGGVTLGGTISIAPTAVTFANQTTQLPPMIDKELVVSGTIGDGSLTRAPGYVMSKINITDHADLNNSVAISYEAINWNVFSPTGGRGWGQRAVTVHGTITVDTITGGGFKPVSFDGDWVTIQGPVVGATQINPRGYAYGKIGGGNKVVLAPGVLDWNLSVSQGEIDTNISASQITLTWSGTLTVGDVINVRLQSTAAAYDQTISFTVVSGDNIGLLVNKFIAGVLSNETLIQAGVGVGASGAASTNAAICNVFYRADDDITITPSVTGAATEVISQAAPILGASCAHRYGVQYISGHTDGSSGYNSDGCIHVGKQAPNNAPTSGGWKNFLYIGGNVNAPDDPDGQPLLIGQWPFDPYADLIDAHQPNSYGGQKDCPIKPARLHSVYNLADVNFTLSNGGPSIAPGHQVYGEGSIQVGGAVLQRAYATGSAPGIVISATGWEGVASLASGGGAANSSQMINRYYPLIDIGFDPFGGQYRPLTTDGLGAVVTFEATPDASGRRTHPSAPPGAMPSTGPYTIMGPSGVGWTINIAWTPANNISMVAGSDGQGVIATTAAQHTFGGYDGSPNARIGSTVGATEFPLLVGGKPGQGASLVASSTNPGNIDMTVLATGKGTVNLGNGTSLNLQLVDPGAPALDWVSITPAIATSSSNRLTIGAVNAPTTTALSLNFASLGVGQGAIPGGQGSANCTIAMGVSSQVYGQNSQVYGFNGYIDQTYGEWAWANGTFANLGDCMERRGGILRAITTSASAVRLVANTTIGTATTTNCINLHNLQLPNNNIMFNLTGEINCLNPTTGDIATWNVRVKMVRTNTTITLRYVSIVRDYADVALNAVADPTIAIDGTNFGLNVSATGIAATTLRWQFRYAGGEVGA